MCLTQVSLLLAQAQCGAWHRGAMYLATKRHGAVAGFGPEALRGLVVQHRRGWGSNGAAALAYAQRNGNIGAALLSLAHLRTHGRSGGRASAAEIVWQNESALAQAVVQWRLYRRGHAHVRCYASVGAAVPTLSATKHAWRSNASICTTRWPPWRGCASSGAEQAQQQLTC